MPRPLMPGKIHLLLLFLKCSSATLLCSNCLCDRLAAVLGGSHLAGKKHSEVHRCINAQSRWQDIVSGAWLPQLEEGPAQAKAEVQKTPQAASLSIHALIAGINAGVAANTPCICHRNSTAAR